MTTLSLGRRTVRRYGIQLLAGLALAAVTAAAPAPAVADDDYAMPAPGVVYNIKTANKDGPEWLLSTDGEGLVDMWGTDDGSERQKWTFEKIREPDIYNIRQVRTRGYLSTDGVALVDLIDIDDGSGRQQWRVERAGGNQIHIFNVASGYYLSTDGDTLVDMYHADDNSGRQRWTVTPEDLVLKDLKWDLEKATVDLKPDFAVTDTLENNTPREQSNMTNFESKAERTSTFEHAHGFSVSFEIEKKFGLPEVAQSTLTISTTTTHNWTEGRSETVADTRNYNFSVVVPPHTTITAKAIVKQAVLNVPYTAVGYSKITKQTIPIEGVWKGVTVGDILQTFDCVPACKKE